VSFILDTVLGIPISYLLNVLLLRAAARFEWPSILRQGDYTERPWRTFYLQTLAWTSVIVVMKAILLVVMYMLTDPLGDVGVWISDDFRGERDEVRIAAFLRRLSFSPLAFTHCDSHSLTHIHTLSRTFTHFQELVFVMVLGPVVLNVIQFWVYDQ
jgi:hypothetical protein